MYTFLFLLPLVAFAAPALATAGLGRHWLPRWLAPTGPAATLNEARMEERWRSRWRKGFKPSPAAAEEREAAASSRRRGGAEEEGAEE